MTDLAIVWDEERNVGDFAIVDGQLKTGDQLSTAILISLFTDRRAPNGVSLPDGETSRRGSWIDLTLPDGTILGSLLWLLERELQTNEVRLRARAYIEEALQWLIDKKVVARIDVTTEWVGPGRLGISIVTHHGDGTERRFDHLWQQVQAAS